MTRITRRRFVQSAAAAAAAPYIIPASAFGANDRITLAHIGVGGMGTGHLNHNAKHKDIQSNTPRTVPSGTPHTRTRFSASTTMG